MERADHDAHGSSSSVLTLADLIAQKLGISPLKCYQCGRCAAGCPQNVPGEMDISPTRVMRLLQLEWTFAGEEAGSQYAQKALAAETPWLCAGCLACTTRCPQGVDIAGTMDVLRQEALRRGVAASTRRARDIQALHKTFLAQALSRGRIHEMSMVMGYKLRTGHLLADAHLAPAMLRKGKLHILPGASVDTERLRKAIESLKKNGGKA